MRGAQVRSIEEKENTEPANILRRGFLGPNRGAHMNNRSTAFSHTARNLLMVLALEAGASTNSPTTSADLALDDAVAVALRDNAGLRASEARWQAMQERPQQARALPNPMLTCGAMDAADGGRWPSANEKRLMVQQEFPWFGKRDLREGIARQDAEAMRQELEMQKRELTLSVKETYFDLYGVQHALILTRQDGDMLRRMVTLAETMYANGERTQQDALKAKSEMPMLQQRLLDLGAQEDALKARLNMLLNRPAETPIGVAVTPPATNLYGRIEDFMAAAATRPEIRAAEAQVARYELESQLMAKEKRPDYRLGAEYRRFGNADDMVMLTIGMDLPIRSSKYEAGIREAEKMKASSEATRESEIRRSALDVQNAWFKLRAARDTLDLYRGRLVPDAIARFEASEAGYRTGKVDFLDLLESQRFLLAAHIMIALTEGNIGMQTARLERAVGVSLQAKPPPGEHHGTP